MATTPSQRPFPFDVRKPIRCGFLMKMRAKRKSFKRCFFVLYKGFLVYYEDDTKWKFDTTKGDTLGVRAVHIRT